MLSPDNLQQSINGYSFPIDTDVAWAPYVLNGAPCRPDGNVLSIPEGGKASQDRFQELAKLAVSTLVDRGSVPTADLIRQTLVDGSIPVEHGINNNYRGGVDCSGFVYFVLKDYGADIDNAIAVTPDDVTFAASRENWRKPSQQELAELIEKAGDRALSLADFTRAFHERYEPHRNVNVARLDHSSIHVDIDDAQPGDIIVYRKSPGISTNHIALITDVYPGYDLEVVHSARKSWNEGLGGISSFVIPSKDMASYFGKNNGPIELRRVEGLKDPSVGSKIID